jgi:DNA-binding SARP family transcriptional activator
MRHDDLAQAAAAPAELRLHLAGEPAMHGAAAQRVPLNHRDAALLVWLAIEGPTPRTRLAALIWPDSALDTARNALRQRRFQLRKLVGADVVVGTSVLSLATGVTHDLTDSAGMLGSRQDEVGGEFGVWLTQQRERRRAHMRQALTLQAEQAQERQDFAQALAHATEILALEPLSEDAHRRVIRLHYLAGDRAAALLAFDRCERVLKDEVGVRPSAETLSLLGTLEQADNVHSADVQRLRVPASVLRPPRLVGRELPWQVLDQAWAAGKCALVLGEAGMGKTRLCTDFANSRGPVLVTGARPGDSRVIYASLSRLLRAVPRPALDAMDAAHRSELARLLPELGTAQALSGPTDRTRFFNAVLSLIDSPLLGIDGIVFDDLHFADDASVDLLHYVASNSACRWIVGARGAEVSDSGRALLDGFDARGDTVRLTLLPLNLAQVQELMLSLDLAGVDAAGLASPLLQHTGGNPLYLLEAVKAWLTGGGGAPVRSELSGSLGLSGPGTLVVLPRLPSLRSVASLIEQRIGRLSMQAVQLARCAAVAAPDFSIDLASHVLGLRTLELADPWAELESAQVLNDGAFAHDLIYESALASVPSAVARRLHGEIALYLLDRDGEPARIAAHWLAAGDKPRALQALSAAAVVADRKLRKREQALLLMQAAELAEELGLLGQAFDALHEATQAWIVADRTQVDDALLDRMARLADTPERTLMVMMDRCRATLNRGDYAEALAQGEAAAKLARELKAHEQEVEALGFAAAAASHRGENLRAVKLLRPCLPWILQHAKPEQQQSFFDDFASVLGNADFLEEALTYHQRALDLALQLGKSFEAATVCGNLTAEFKDTGDLQRAFDTLQQARRLVVGFDDVQGLTWQFDLMSLALLRDLARYSDALRAGELALLSAVQHRSVLSLVHGHLAGLWLNLGQTARAGQALAEAQRLASAESRRARLAQLQGRMLWNQERPADEAFADALAHAPLTGRTVLQSMIELDHALVLDPGQALVISTEVMQRCADLDYRGVALAARIRCTRFAVAAGQTAQAVHWAEAALADAATLLPDDLYRAELWLNAGLAFQAAGQQQRALTVATAGRDWVMRTAGDHVPPEFRDSFLHRNRVNRELLALAARWDQP